MLLLRLLGEFTHLLLADGSTCPCCPLRGGLPSLSPACPAFSLLCCPHPPARARRALFPSGEGGDFLFSYARGFAPCIPAPKPARHLQRLSSRCPAQREVHGFPPEWQEMLSLEQCRQPRRGGTGGDGTIRRKRRRRLRWSSPPGQGEPVPSGFSPPPGAANARRAGEAGASPPAGTAAAG